MACINHAVGSNLKIKGVMQGDRKNVITPFCPPKVKPVRLNKMTKLVSGSTPALPPPSGKPRKLHNCLPPGTPKSRPTTSNLKRKSISLVELTSSSKIWTQKKLTSREQGDDSKIKHVIVTLDRKCTISFINSRAECELARKACKMFLLNAWRRSRNQIQILQMNKQKVEKEVENLNLQIVVLQSLLESEKLRVAVAMGDSTHLKGRLEAELKNIEQFKKERENLKAANFNLENLQKHMAKEIEQLKAKLISEQEKCKNYQEVIADKKRKLAISKQRETEYLEKTNKTELALKEKINNIEAFRISINELREELTKTRFENTRLQEEKEIKENETNEHITKIKEDNLNITLMQKRCKAQKETIKQLSKDFDIAKERIEEQSQTIESLNVVVGQLEEERKELDQNLFNIRNKVVFQSVRIITSLLFPDPLHILI